MKRLATIQRVIAVTVIMVITGWVQCLRANGFGTAQYADTETDTPDDSIEVSLITCSAGGEVYSLYGHTALRFHDLRNGEDLTFNYGVFSFRKPFFALRFTMGLTDYELGVIPFNYFRMEYARTGRGIVEQVLNLTTVEKQALYCALMENYLPQNRVYRYNFFYNNCTTKARDMIERCIDGETVYPERQQYPTYRQAIHKHTAGHPWASFGNDLCIGAKADRMMSLREQLFLPSNLENDFEKAYIKSADGRRRPLVTSTRTVLEPQTHTTEKEFPLSPTQCACLLLAISAAMAFIEYMRKRTFVAWDCLLMLVTGMAGVIITALFFSKHPTTSTNLQILLLNPIPLLYIYNVARRRKTNYWKISLSMIILFLIGAFLQEYAEGMCIVALSLLTRCWTNIKFPSYRQ